MIRSLLLPLGLLLVAGCTPPSPDDLERPTSSPIEANLTAKDWIEGAYSKQGGTAVHFIFFRGKAGSADDTFFGEVDDNGTPVRASGHFRVGRNKSGTAVQLTLDDDTGASGQHEPQGLAPTPDAGPSSSKCGGWWEAACPDAGTTTTPAPTADAGTSDPGLPVDTRSLKERAFAGTKDFLKIGQHDTILIRNPVDGKTAHYRKIKTWCGTGGDADCAPSVQNTGLQCARGIACTEKHTCACQ